MKRQPIAGWLAAALLGAVLGAGAMWELDRAGEEAPPAAWLSPAPASAPDPALALLPAPAPPPQRVNLVSANYPPAVAGPGWDYHKALDGDFDGDGQPEKLHVITNAGWDEKTGQFAWDDGHPWHVYIDEAGGARTYLFSNWVQIGVLDAFLTTDPAGVLILSRQGASVNAYKVAYRGPGQQEAVQLMSVPVNGIAGFTDPRFYGLQTRR